MKRISQTEIRKASIDKMCSIMRRGQRWYTFNERVSGSIAISKSDDDYDGHVMKWSDFKFLSFDDLQAYEKIYITMKGASNPNLVYLKK